jgi:hypothetical protein
MTDRWQNAIEAWNNGDRFIEVSVPLGEDGDVIRDILERAKLRGVQVEMGKRAMLHEDGRMYKVTHIKGQGAREVADRCVAEQAMLKPKVSQEEGDAIYKGRK